MSRQTAPSDWMSQDFPCQLSRNPNRRSLISTLNIFGIGPNQLMQYSEYSEALKLATLATSMTAFAPDGQQLPLNLSRRQSTPPTTSNISTSTSTNTITNNIVSIRSNARP